MSKLIKMCTLNMCIVERVSDSSGKLLKQQTTNSSHAHPCQGVKVPGGGRGDSNTAVALVTKVHGRLRRGGQERKKAFPPGCLVLLGTDVLANAIWWALCQGSGAGDEGVNEPVWGTKGLTSEYC